MLQQQQKNLICDGVQVTIFQPKAVVCKKGDRGESLLIVKSGQLEGYANGACNGLSSHCFVSRQYIQRLYTTELIYRSDGRIYKAGDHFGTACLLAETDRDTDINVIGEEAAVCIEVRLILFGQ